jgi:hypothetical protein
VIGKLRGRVDGRFLKLAAVAADGVDQRTELRAVVLVEHRCERIAAGVDVGFGIGFVGHQAFGDKLAVLALVSLAQRDAHVADALQHLAGERQLGGSGRETANEFAVGVKAEIRAAK